MGCFASTTRTTLFFVHRGDASLLPDNRDPQHEHFSVQLL